MSLMKRYKQDCEELITELFQDCGTAAGVYADPASVCALFVNLVSETYAAEFMAQKEAV